MSRSLWRALLALVVLSLSTLSITTTPVQLGLDLRGGSSITLEARGTAERPVTPAMTDAAIEVLRGRVDVLGVAEPSLSRSGDDRIVVELPGLKDASQAVETLGETARLSFHPVEAGSAEAPNPLPQPPEELDLTKPSWLLDEDERPLRVGPSALGGEAVKGATVTSDPRSGVRSVSLSFQGEGGRKWEELTARAACLAGDQRRVAIVLDGRVISSPQIAPEVSCEVGIVGGSTQITGQFTASEAAKLAALVEGGALPVPVEVIERSSVGASLGADAIDQSLRAGIIGLAATAIFLVVVYRLMGLAAVLGLASYGVISYGALLALGATLTLPGLAGLLLSAGLAIDANVLVFERAREEWSERTGVRGALERGFSRALSAITDSNATTLLAAGLLFLLASGPVRGFGVTLVIGVVASMISALLVTRVVLDLGVTRGPLARRPGAVGVASLGRLRRFLERRRPDLMRWSRRYLGLAGVLVALALAGVGVRGLELGVEFTGGRSVTYQVAGDVAPAEAREVVARAGVEDATVVERGDDELNVRAGSITDPQIVAVRDGLARAGGSAEVRADAGVGPTLGSEIRTKALLALGLALAAQMVYLAIRFRWSFAAATVLAMLHDVVVVVGLFAWLGKPIDGLLLAATLTIIGVSVNDSVVTLDRIREQWSKARTTPLREVVNAAVLATAPRTVNTGLGACFILAALVVLGGSSLTDFALALLAGLVVGTFSSAFLASPLLLELERWSKAPPPMPKRPAAPPVQRRRPTSAR